MTTLAVLENLPPSQQHLFERQHFPSKFGGFPSFLVPQNIPGSLSLNCSTCSSQMKFLLQLYVPLDDDEHSTAFHRTLYLFICNTPACQGLSTSVKVLRAQLPKHNPFYKDSPPISTDQPLSQLPPLCSVCGCLAPLRCSSCKAVWYCCKNHQVLHWQECHSKECPTFTDEPSLTQQSPSSFCFKQYWIECEDEPDSDEEVTIEDKFLSEKDMKDFENVAKVDESLSLFAEFSARISRNSKQIIRYCFDGEPLWPCPQPNLTVPNCSYCGSKRVFEFQVLPSIIYLGNTDNVDFTSLLIYSCENSCDCKHEYVEEFVYVLK
ncbi:hypothetical protein P9112_011808 [Eukaryota sp. TZLM1-RC]